MQSINGYQDWLSLEGEPGNRGIGESEKREIGESRNRFLFTKVRTIVKKELHAKVYKHWLQTALALMTNLYEC